MNKMILKNMLNMQMMMFLLIAIGFLVRKQHLVGTEGRKNMVNLCLYITLPFNILNSFLMEWHWDMLWMCGMILLLSFGYNAIGIVMSHVLYRKETEARRKTLRYGTIVSNGGFLGNPIVEGIYGSNGLFYASIFMIPVRIVMWSVGISVFLKGHKENLLKKVLTHPCIIAVYVGAILMGMGVQLPIFLGKTITSLSNCNTPLSMMLIGMMLAEMNPKGLLDQTMVWYAAVRLLLIPGIVFGITAMLPIQPLLRGVAVIIAGMPTPVTAVLLSSKYEGDERYATGMIFVTTILSLFTLPFWCAFL